MPIGRVPYNVTVHSHTKAGALAAIEAAFDVVIASNAVLAPLRSTVINAATSAIDFAADPLTGQEVYIQVAGNVDSWELGRPDVLTGVKINVEISVAAEL